MVTLLWSLCKWLFKGTNYVRWSNNTSSQSKYCIYGFRVFLINLCKSLWKNLRRSLKWRKKKQVKQVSLSLWSQNIISWKMILINRYGNNLKTGIACMRYILRKFTSFSCICANPIFNRIIKCRKYNVENCFHFATH